MKKQTNNSHRAFIAITFLITLLTMTACNEGKEPTQNAAVSETKVKPPKIDIHTAVMTDNPGYLPNLYHSYEIFVPAFVFTIKFRSFNQ